MKSIYIEGSDNSMGKMFCSEGWVVLSRPGDADLICFSGGSDVAPMLYEQVKHKRTSCDYNRDQECSDLFHKFVFEKPMVGICRGAQFLNVMCGGELYQHTNGHNLTGATHPAMDPQTGQIFDVTSDHHQMMIPTEMAEVLLVGEESSFREPTKLYSNAEPVLDIEAVFYSEENCLCYQPHPEWVSKGHDCWDLFFIMVEEFSMEGSG